MLVLFIVFDYKLLSNSTMRKMIIIIIIIPLLGGCYGKSCKLNGQHTRARNHSAITRVVIALHKLLHRGPGLMIFTTALSKRNRI